MGINTACRVAIAAGIAFLLSVNALAFDTSLPPEEIEQAYSLGQTTHREDLADFLKQYEHDFQYPSDHPVAYVSSVEFQTPYEQIVLRAARTTGYTKFKAADDYNANPNRIVVHVIVGLRINYAGTVPPAESYTVTVSQAKRIEPKKSTNTVTCDPYSPVASPLASTDCRIYTRELDLNFDAAQFAPGPVTVRVDLPFDQSLETKYNLDKLK